MFILNIKWKKYKWGKRDRQTARKFQIVLFIFLLPLKRNQVYVWAFKMPSVVDKGINGE